MTRSQYEKLDRQWSLVEDTAKSEVTNDCLGIVPVIVTPVNALYFQNLLTFNCEGCYLYTDYTDFN